MMREWSSRDVLGYTSRLSAVFWICPTQFGITPFGVNCKTKIWEGVVKFNWSDAQILKTFLSTISIFTFCANIWPIFSLVNRVKGFVLINLMLHWARPEIGPKNVF